MRAALRFLVAVLAVISIASIVPLSENFSGYAEATQHSASATTTANSTNCKHSIMIGNASVLLRDPVCSGPLKAIGIGNLAFHGGSIMHNPAFYLIFWLPSGYSFDTTGNSNYVSLIENYFSNVCQSNPFYNILQQYPDSLGPPGQCSLGGIATDTDAFPSGKGSQSNPLSESEIMAELQLQMSENQWSSNNGNNEFFVFAPLGVYSCVGGICDFGSVGFCAYHDHMNSTSSSPVIFAYMPDAGSDSCIPKHASPNADPSADAEINLVAHEQFESISDPQFSCNLSSCSGGWFYQDGTGEIGDECAWLFGYVDADGSTIWLNGHEFSVQEMWSNSASGCILPPRPQVEFVTPFTNSLPAGQSTNITAVVRNAGGEAVWQQVSLSFPFNVTQSRIELFPSDIPAVIIPPNSEVQGCYGHCYVNTTYPSIVGQTTHWLGGDVHRITVRVTPQSTGSLTLYLKATAVMKGTSNESAWSPTSLDSITIDQQNEYALPIVFNVTNQQFIGLSADSGMVGTAIGVTGTAFASSSPVMISFDGVTRTTAPSSVLTGSTGGFLATVKVPLAVSGVHTITATDGTGSSATMIFTVVPSVHVGLVQNVYGSYFAKIIGKGFAGYATITVYLDGAYKKTVTSGQYGGFSTSIHVKSGFHSINVSDRAGHIFWSGFIVP